jgi:hypothetical protein
MAAPEPLSATSSDPGATSDSASHSTKRGNYCSYLHPLCNSDSPRLLSVVGRIDGGLLARPGYPVLLSKMAVSLIEAFITISVVMDGCRRHRCCRGASQCVGE